MIAVRKESNEVLYPNVDVVLVDFSDLEELKRLSGLNPRKRIRLCGHRSPTDDLHEMFIVHTIQTYVRPHKHIGKAESFSILEGLVDVVLFYDDGSIRQVIKMGAPASGLPFYYRLADAIFHTLLVRSEYLVFHEVTKGPFLREQTVFAEWSQTDMNPSFSHELAAEVLVKQMIIPSLAK